MEAQRVGGYWAGRVGGESCDQGHLVKYKALDRGQAQRGQKQGREGNVKTKRVWTYGQRA